MTRAMASRPRILVLTPRYPYPVIGGDRLRIYQVCKALAPTCDLTLLSLCDSKDELMAPLPTDGVFQRVERILLPRWRSVLSVLGALLTRVPLQVAYYRSAEFNRRIQQLLPEHDAGLAHLIRTGDYVRHSPKPIFLEMTDAISLNYQRVKAVGSKHHWKSWVYAVEARRLLDYERKAVNEFAGVALVSAIDRDFLLQSQANPRVLVCSNGVDVSHLPFSRRSDAERVIVFIGNMTTVQNLDACQYFIEEVLPLLRRHGDFRFRIVGRMHAADAARLNATAGVEVRANVASVADEVGDAYAAVAPMRLGAGVQNKVLEYMALGLATVSSRIGLEGLNAEPDKALLVAGSADEWVTQLLTLWRDTAQRGRMAENARRYVESEHMWQSMLAPMVASVHCILADASGPPNSS